MNKELESIRWKFKYGDYWNKIKKYMIIMGEILKRRELLECVNCKNTIKFEYDSFDSQVSCPYCDGILRKVND